MNTRLNDHLLYWFAETNQTEHAVLCRRLLTKMDKRQKSAAYLDGLVSANTSVSKYADPIAAEPSDALAPALEHADARARLLASLKSHKHKEMVQAGMNVSINVQRGRVP